MGEQSASHFGLLAVREAPDTKRLESFLVPLPVCTRWRRTKSLACASNRKTILVYPDRNLISVPLSYAGFLHHNPLEIKITYRRFLNIMCIPFLNLVCTFTISAQYPKQKVSFHFPQQKEPQTAPKVPSHNNFTLVSFSRIGW